MPYDELPKWSVSHDNARGERETSTVHSKSPAQASMARALEVERDGTFCARRIFDNGELGSVNVFRVTRTGNGKATAERL